MGMISKQKMTSNQLILFSSMGLKLHWLGIAWKAPQCSLYDQPPESKKITKCHSNYEPSKVEVVNSCKAEI